jgi:hypothetical protein
MNVPCELFPVVVFEDRYGGSYAGGAWVAIANATWGGGPAASRLDFVFDGAGGGDIEACEFWDEHRETEWIGVGSTPDLAVQVLVDRHFARLNGMTRETAEKGEGLR